MLKQVYIGKNVLTAAQERINAVFSDFENIVVSVSGGKDSTVLAHLVLSKAQELQRKVTVFFLDEEIEYQSTIEQIQYLLFEMFPAVTIPVWWQIEMKLSNATSLSAGNLVGWEDGVEWIRPKDPRSVHVYPYTKKYERNKQYGFGVFDAFKSFDAHQKNTCILLGLRAAESPSRFHAVAYNAGHKDWNWSTALKTNSNITAYPIYDWQFADVWKYIAENKIRYNKIYDYMWRKGLKVNEFRISSLIHDKAFRSLVELAEFEPETYDKIIRRVNGALTASIYGKEKLGLKAQQLPKNFKSWIDYRDFLIATYPDREKVKIFVERFKNQPNNNAVARQQCRQLVLNDKKNHFPADISKGTKIKERLVNKWKDLL